MRQLGTHRRSTRNDAPVGMGALLRGAVAGVATTPAIRAPGYGLRTIGQPDFRPQADTMGEVAKSS